MATHFHVATPFQPRIFTLSFVREELPEPPFAAPFSVADRPGAKAPQPPKPALAALEAVREPAAERGWCGVEVEVKSGGVCRSFTFSG